ncbi:hypothetical protein CLF_108081 [Clonorchis sinensis]|uniref:Pol-related protein n=1 Tax=Clonorchis sinensis TaxID=79923 RepID=G7YHK6_CLOSI|nr:hypothetical protein CLF_108081 [Clonorchis sinensis]
MARATSTVSTTAQPVPILRKPGTSSNELVLMIPTVTMTGYVAAEIYSRNVLSSVHKTDDKLLFMEQHSEIRDIWRFYWLIQRPPAQRHTTRPIDLFLYIDGITLAIFLKLARNRFILLCAHQFLTNQCILDPGFQISDETFVDMEYADTITFFQEGEDVQMFLNELTKVTLSFGMHSAPTKYKLTTGDTEDELAFRKMRNRCKSEIRQWNIRKQATILDLARKNRNVLFKYMRHRRRNKPSAFSLRDRNGEPTSDPIVVPESYRDHYAGLYSVTASSSHPTLSRRTYERPLTDLGFTVEDIRQLLHKINPFCALGPDEVHPRILKETSYTLATHFHLLFRQSLDEGHLPSVWKETPIYKTGRTKDVILIERVRRAATKMVGRLKSMDYETRLAMLDLFLLKYRHLRGDLILTYALFEQGLANRFFTVDPANAWRGHGERQPLNDKNKTDPGNLGESLDPVYQSVNL